METTRTAALPSSHRNRLPLLPPKTEPEPGRAAHSSVGPPYQAPAAKGAVPAAGLHASVLPACLRHPLTQQEGARGEGDVVRQQMLQEEGEEVAVEMAVKDLQPNAGSEEAAGLEGSWEQAGSQQGSSRSQEQTLTPCPSTQNMPE